MKKTTRCECCGSDIDVVGLAKTATLEVPDGTQITQHFCPACAEVVDHGTPIQRLRSIELITREMFCAELSDDDL